MGRTPLVSIVVPFFNPGRMFAGCLESIAQQTYAGPIEVVLVDNNSSDGSAGAARDFVSRMAAASHGKRTVKLTDCATQGHSVARNHGFAQASGEYIQWLDADDLLGEKKIEAQVEALESSPGHDIAYGDWAWHLWKGERCVDRLTILSPPTEDYLLQLLVDHWRPPNTYLLRRSAAEKLDAARAWNPETSVQADREYFTLAAAFGMRFLHVAGVAGVYNTWSRTQVAHSASPLEMLRCQKRIFERVRDALPPSAEVSAVHRRLLAQSWDVYRLAALAISVKGGEATVTNLETGERTLTDARTADLINWMQFYGGAYNLEQHARAIVKLLLHHFVAQGRAGTSDVDARARLASLFEDAPRIPAPAVPLDALPRAPLASPFFGAERAKISALLEDMRARGWLVAELSL